MLKKEEAAWSMPVKQLYQYFKTSPSGLTAQQVQERWQSQGPNDLEKKERWQALRLFVWQFRSPLILILLAATVISYVLGERLNAAVIFLMICLNVILAFFQEYRAEQTINELKKYVSYTAKVLRDGQVQEIDSRELVQGDIVYLARGDVVPADIRVLKVRGLTVDESSLTGESLPVSKTVNLLSAHQQLPTQLHNMVFLGTTIMSGTAHGIITATGKKTFFGHTAAYLHKKEPEADFQKSIHKFSKLLVKIIVVMTLFIFLVNAFLGKGHFNSFMFALALAVGITPEILPVVMTVTLSRGASNMAKENVITKRLSSVEDLGNIDTLCCDKTGTLTEGKLTLYNYVDLEGRKDVAVLLGGILSGSTRGVSHKTQENPIDLAIAEHHAAKGIMTEVEQYQFLAENEFDYERRRIGVVVRKNSQVLLKVKGAPESVLNVSSGAFYRGKTQPLTPSRRKTIFNQVKKYELDGYKVIAVAEKSFEKLLRKTKATGADEHHLTLRGFLLFIDPPKKSAKEALTLLQRLGVKVKIITGDSPTVTWRICKEVGLFIAKNRIITGEELEGLTPQKLGEYAQTYSVFARVSPEQKYNLVASLNKENHIVGFLGDGVNDAPALKAADVGIAVDTGSNIAKEAADIILLKKSLHAIVIGIEQGRKIFSNITKYILNTISANYGNMFTIALSSLFLKFLPLLPVQILLNNFVSDIPNLTIATDQVDPELLHKPRRWNFQLISHFMLYFGILSSLFDLILIILLLLVFHSTTEVFRTAWFVMSAISEIIILFSLRTHLTFFRSKPSMWLVLVSFITIFWVLALPYLWWGQKFFEFVPLTGEVLVLIGFVLLGYFIAVEIAKRFFYKKFSE